MTRRTPPPRHRAPGRARGPLTTSRTVRRLGILGAAAALTGGALTPGVTGATFTDEARATISIGTTEFPCRSSVVAPFRFDQAPVDNGAGVWTRDSALCSPNRRYIAVFQVDGNFVLYDTWTAPFTPVWNTWTFGEHVGGRGTALVLQSDGNVGLFTTTGVRQTYTGGVPSPATLTLGDDANLVLWDATWTPRWQSHGTETLDCRTSWAFTCQTNNLGWGE